MARSVASRVRWGRSRQQDAEGQREPEALALAGSFLALRSKVKRWTALLFFLGASPLAVLTLLLPDPGETYGAWGRALFWFTLVLGAGTGLFVAARPALVAAGRLDPWLMIAGNACVLAATLGETFLFGSQWSRSMVLWPVVFVAGFFRSRLMAPQVALTLLTLALLLGAEHRFIRANALWWVELIVLGMTVVFTGLAVYFFRTVSVREAYELTHLAQRDGLTGLLNRRTLLSAFGGFAARAGGKGSGQGVGLILLDLDHFKRVNDTHGHAAGDEMLRTFAQTLEDAAAPGDLTVRLGGEEFVWVTSGAELGEVQARVERLRSAFTARSGPYAVTASAGGVFVPAGRPPPDLGELLTLADAELYRVKEAGRDHSRFTVLGN